MFTGQLGTPDSKLGWIVLGAVAQDLESTVRWPFSTDIRWDTDPEDRWAMT